MRGKEIFREEVFAIENHVYQDMINVVFTNDIAFSITEQCDKRGINPKKYVPKGANAVVCRVDSKTKTGERVRGTWVLFDFNLINDGIIVHECVHIAKGLLFKRGLYLNCETEEAYAYLIQWLFNQIKGFHNEFLEMKKKSRKKV